MKTSHYFQIRFISVCVFIFFITGPVRAVPESGKWVVENKQIKLEMIARTPEQMAAFYEARGFPRKVLDEVKKMCFITVGVTNKSRDIIWMRLANWTFSLPQGSLKRFHRNELKARWQQFGLAQRHQSTFRWTLIPEVLDYRPEEHEGGNIVLPRTGSSFSLRAEFVMGANEQGKHISIQLNDLRCTED